MADRCPHEFWLVQRLKEAHPGNTKTGFDHVFTCDYMGSAEFEFGTVPQSLKRLRASQPVLRIVSMSGRDVYFVGPEAALEVSAEQFRAWCEAGLPRGQEATYFREHFTGTAKDYQQGIVAWWSLNNDLMWTLDADVAERLLAAVQG